VVNSGSSDITDFRSTVSGNTPGRHPAGRSPPQEKTTGRHWNNLFKSGETASSYVICFLPARATPLLDCLPL
jgi:hypothetical protein